MKGCTLTAVNKSGDGRYNWAEALIGVTARLAAIGGPCRQNRTPPEKCLRVELKPVSICTDHPVPRLLIGQELN